MGEFSGILDRSDNGSRLMHLSGIMKANLSLSNRARMQEWHDDHLVLLRSHHGGPGVHPQPVSNTDGSVLLMLEGEVFNLREQFDELPERGPAHSEFASDSARCLHLYERVGAGVFSRMNGSFLFAVYHVDTRQLLLINDRFSSRPLFYSNQDDTLLFSTCVGAILRCGVDPLPDWSAAYELFAFQAVLGAKTLHKNIRSLPSSSILSFSSESLSLTTYWRKHYRNERRDADYYSEALADGLRQAVRARTRGRLRYGILLSGGLDSRAVLAAAGPERISKAFTVGDAWNREVRVAQSVARAVGNIQFRFLLREVTHYYEIVPAATRLCGGMYRFDHAQFLGLLSNVGAECDIILHGYGLDYLFRGINLPLYSPKIAGRRLPPIHFFLRRISLDQLPDALWSLLVRPSQPWLLFKRERWPEYRESVRATIDEALTAGRDIYNSDAHNGWDYFAPDHLTLANVLSIRPFVDERTVSCDNNLLDLHLAMPPRMRLAGRIYRKAIHIIDPRMSRIPYANTGMRPDLPLASEWLFRTAVEAIAFLAKSRGRTKLPDRVRTQGSWADMENLIRHEENLRNLIHTTLNDSRCLDPTVFDIDYINRIFNAHVRQQRNFTDQLLLLATFGRWWRDYGENHA